MSSKQDQRDDGLRAAGGSMTNQSFRALRGGAQSRGGGVIHKRDDVFDLSQNEGDELPDLDAVRPKLLDDDGPEGIWGRRDS